MHLHLSLGGDRQFPFRFLLKSHPVTVKTQVALKNWKENHDLGIEFTGNGLEKRRLHVISRHCCLSQRSHQWPFQFHDPTIFPPQFLPLCRKRIQAICISSNLFTGKPDQLLHQRRETENVQTDESSYSTWIYVDSKNWGKPQQDQTLSWKMTMNDRQNYLAYSALQCKS